MCIETKLNELRDRLAKTQVSPGGKSTIDEAMKQEIVGIMVALTLTIEPTAKSLGIEKFCME